MAYAKFSKERLLKLIRAANKIAATNETPPEAVTAITTLLFGRALARFDTSDVEEAMIDYIDEADKKAAAAIARRKKRRKAKA